MMWNIIIIIIITVDNFEIQEVALHTGELTETVYSVSADIMDGVGDPILTITFKVDELFILWFIVWID